MGCHTDGSIYVMLGAALCVGIAFVGNAGQGVLYKGCCIGGAV